MKPGYQTTEFWLTVIAVLVPIAQAFGIQIAASPELAQTLAGGATIAYAVQRAFVKHKFLKLVAASTTTIVHKFVGDVTLPSTITTQTLVAGLEDQLAPALAPITSQVTNPPVVETPQIQTPVAAPPTVVTDPPLPVNPPTV